MSIISFKSCEICGQAYLESENPGYCSKKCFNLSTKDLVDIKECISSVENTSDKRIFFYDIGIGEACDKYCILLLRYRHQAKLVDTNETDKELRKLWDCIRSKINKSCYHPDTKKAVAELIGKLFVSNAKMWRLRDLVSQGDQYSSAANEAAHNYFTESFTRDSIRNEIDLLVEGRPRTIRVYPT